jgi:hypothetical protein
LTFHFSWRPGGEFKKRCLEDDGQYLISTKNDSASSTALWRLFYKGLVFPPNLATYLTTPLSTMTHTQHFQTVASPGPHWYISAFDAAPYRPPYPPIRLRVAKAAISLKAGITIYAAAYSPNDLPLAVSEDFISEGWVTFIGESNLNILLQNDRYKFLIPTRYPFDPQTWGNASAGWKWRTGPYIHPTGTPTPSELWPNSPSRSSTPLPSPVYPPAIQYYSHDALVPTSVSPNGVMLNPPRHSPTATFTHSVSQTHTLDGRILGRSDAHNHGDRDHLDSLGRNRRGSRGQSDMGTLENNRHESHSTTKRTRKVSYAPTPIELRGRDKLDPPLSAHHGRSLAEPSADEWGRSRGRTQKEDRAPGKFNRRASSVPRGGGMEQPDVPEFDWTTFGKETREPSEPQSAGPSSRIKQAGTNILKPLQNYMPF